MLYQAAQEMSVLLHESIGEEASVKIEFSGPDGAPKIEIQVDLEESDSDMHPLDVDGIVRQHPMFADDGPLRCVDTGSAIKDGRAVSRDLCYVLPPGAPEASKAS